MLHIAFKENVPLQTKIKALGGKYEHIKNIVPENSITWKDQFLELVEIEELFGRSAEKVGEFIVLNAGAWIIVGVRTLGGLIKNADDRKAKSPSIRSAV